MHSTERLQRLTRCLVRPPQPPASPLVVQINHRQPQKKRGQSPSRRGPHEGCDVHGISAMIGRLCLVEPARERWPLLSLNHVQQTKLRIVPLHPRMLPPLPPQPAPLLRSFHPILPPVKGNIRSEERRVGKE